MRGEAPKTLDQHESSAMRSSRCRSSSAFVSSCLRISSTTATGAPSAPATSAPRSACWFSAASPLRPLANRRRAHGAPASSKTNAIRCHSFTRTPATAAFPESCRSDAISKSESVWPCSLRVRYTSRPCRWSRLLIDSKRGHNSRPSNCAASARSQPSIRGFRAPINCRVR